VAIIINSIVYAMIPLILCQSVTVSFLIGVGLEGFYCMDRGQISILRLSNVPPIFLLWKKNTQTKPGNIFLRRHIVAR
jgi:hypothetical protein